MFSVSLTGNHRLSYFDSAGVRIRFIERGAGEPVVLVHSYGGDLQNEWVETGVLDALARSYRAIAFDVRGHGGSDTPHDPNAYGAQTAWDIVRLLDHLALAKAHIVGYSMGAHIVAQLLTLAPQRFLTAVLGGASGRRGWSAEDDRRTEIESKEMDEGLIASQIARLRARDAPALTAAELKDISDAFLKGKDRHAVAAMRRSNRDQVVTLEEMAAVRVPVLGIVGAKDPYRRSFDALKEILPALKLVVLEDATHLTTTVHPEFVPAILRFLGSYTKEKRA